MVKKEPITPEMISSICSKYASPSANLSSLRIAALFITAYCAFITTYCVNLWPSPMSQETIQRYYYYYYYYYYYFYALMS